MPDGFGAASDTAVYAGASAQAWFAGGERVGYDPRAQAIVAAEGAPLKIFLRREGELAHAVTFMPGFPDGSFGWAKVLPHLPNAAEMPKLFVEYVGMGDSDKPRTMPIPLLNAPISSRRFGGISPSCPQRWSPSIFPRLSSPSTCDADLSAPSVESLRVDQKYVAFSFSMVGSFRTGIPTHGSPRRFYAASPSLPVVL